MEILLYQVLLRISKILKGTEFVSAETWMYAATEFSGSPVLCLH
jgi:hypothetical protein